MNWHKLFDDGPWSLSCILLFNMSLSHVFLFYISYSWVYIFHYMKNGVVLMGWTNLIVFLKTMLDCWCVDNRYMWEKEYIMQWYLIKPPFGSVKEHRRVIEKFKIAKWGILFLKQYSNFLFLTQIPNRFIYPTLESLCQIIENWFICILNGGKKESQGWFSLGIESDSTSMEKIE